MKRTTAALILILAAAAMPAAAINLHELNGSDLGLGVGARAMSMGGAFSALADDASALYWNPAGMTNMKNGEEMFHVDTDPVRYSFKAIVFHPGKRDVSHRGRGHERDKNLIGG